MISNHLQFLVYKQVTLTLPNPDRCFRPMGLSREPSSELIFFSAGSPFLWWYMGPCLSRNHSYVRVKMSQLLTLPCFSLMPLLADLHRGSLLSKQKAQCNRLLGESATPGGTFLYFITEIKPNSSNNTPGSPSANCSVNSKKKSFPYHK